MKQKNKIFRLNIRMSETTSRKLDAICEVGGKGKTTTIENLIEEEFRRDKKYEDKYYSKF